MKAMEKALIHTCLVATLMIVIITLIGCDTKPTNMDPNSAGWELYTVGTVESKRVEKVSSGGRIFVVDFEDNFTVRAKRFPNYSDVVAGDKGKMYRFPSGVDKPTYLWQSFDKKPIIVATKKIIREKPEELSIPVLAAKFVPIAEETSKYQWKSTNISKPLYGQTVLVRLENNIVTTAYIDKKEEWKQEIYKFKFSSGPSLENVVEWKEIDLD